MYIISIYSLPLVQIYCYHSMTQFSLSNLSEKKMMQKISERKRDNFLNSQVYRNNLEWKAVTGVYIELGGGVLVGIIHAL